MPRIAGVRVAGLAAGLKPDGRHDLFMAELAPGSTVAGTLTRSGFPGAPVEWTRKLLPRGKVRAIVANSGNSNVFTGRAGPAQVEATATAAAKLLGCPKSQVLLASTGRIGVKRAPDFVASKLPRAMRKLKAGAWHDAARAIMTTDSFPKAAVRTALIGETRVTLAGIAKGCTMIAPDMGTMLSFLFTDARVPAKVLRAVLRRAVDLSFNSMKEKGPGCDEPRDELGDHSQCVPIGPLNIVDDDHMGRDLAKRTQRVHQGLFHPSGFLGGVERR